MQQKKLMLLGGIHYLLPVIEMAHKLGAYVITVDYIPTNIAHKYSDEYINLSIMDQEAVLQAAQERRIDGILSFGVDPGVVTAAYVAEKMGLVFSPLASVEILQNKDKFRDFLQNNGFNCPFHFSFKADENPLDNEELRNKLEKEHYSVIVKPVDSAGSKGCSHAHNLQELEKSIAYARSESHNGKIIIEQFLENVAHASDSDCFSIDSNLVYCSFDCQYFDHHALNPYTPAAYSWPSDMPMAAQQELYSELSRLVKMLKLGTTIYNIETRYCTDGKAYIMEVSPRGGGNRVAEGASLSTHQDLIANCVRAALRMPLLPMTAPVYYDVIGRVLVHANKSGIYKGIEIAEKVKASFLKEEDMWVKAGDHVEEFSGANKCIGSLQFQFNTHEEAAAILDAPDTWLKVLVE